MLDKLVPRGATMLPVQTQRVGAPSLLSSGIPTRLLETCTHPPTILEWL